MIFVFTFYKCLNLHKHGFWINFSFAKVLFSPLGIYLIYAYVPWKICDFPLGKISLLLHSLASEQSITFRNAKQSYYGLLKSSYAQLLES